VVTAIGGRAIAQEVSCRLFTAAARIRAHVKSCGICGGRSGSEAGFLRVLLFSLPIHIPPTAPHSSFGAGTIGQLVAGVQYGLSLTPPQETKILQWEKWWEAAVSLVEAELSDRTCSRHVHLLIERMFSMKTRRERGFSRVEPRFAL
jgi:hypothetical protein